MILRIAVSPGKNTERCYAPYKDIRPDRRICYASPDIALRRPHGYSRDGTSILPEFFHVR
jgi:hypothetical protein